MILVIYHPGLPAYRPRFVLVAIDHYKLIEKPCWRLAGRGRRASGERGHRNEKAGPVLSMRPRDAARHVWTNLYLYCVLA